MSRQINLYDASFRPKRELLSAQNLLLGSLLAVFIVSMGAMATRWSIASQEQQAKSIHAQLLAERAAFASLASVLGTRKADPVLKQEILDLEQALQGARSALTLLHNMLTRHDSPVVGEMMRAFSRVSLDGLWLTGFLVQEGGKRLEIRGRMVDQAILPNYLKRLEAEPVFHGRRFSALDMKGGEWLPPTTTATGMASLPVAAPQLSLDGLLPPAAQGVASLLASVGAMPTLAAPSVPAPAPAAAVSAPVSGRWYIDFTLSTQRDEKSAAEGSGR